MGITCGDFLAGLISQLLKSRKKALGIFLVWTTLAIALYFLLGGISVTMFYGVIIFGGLATGYWSVFMSTVAESFGTNIRATATTTAPNFVRGSTILISFVLSLVTMCFHDKIMSTIITGGIFLAIAFWALYHLHDPFGEDLDYTEK
ncbi:MAG TPA: MFS transporter, partial [Bacteroidia bacterium]|nr:MFS transporter [Bacteroidia bacterium]